MFFFTNETRLVLIKYCVRFFKVFIWLKNPTNSDYVIQNRKSRVGLDFFFSNLSCVEFFKK